MLACDFIGLVCGSILKNVGMLLKQEECAVSWENEISGNMAATETIYSGLF